MPQIRPSDARLLIWTLLALLTTGVAFTADADGDEVDDAVDNCPGAYNPGQEDLDLDAAGDACDTDTVVAAAVALSAPGAFVNLRVASGGTLTADAGVSVTGNMAIEAGGTVTHSSRLPAGLVLDVDGTLEVQAGGEINVDGRGLLGGRAGSAFGDAGEAIDPLTGAVVAGATRASGAAYGGPGASQNGSTNPPYGTIEGPLFVGSGGGADNYGGAAGGNGGGLVTITAGVLVLDGAIRADGGNGSALSGGGSGGGVMIDVGALTGAGTVQANGGDDFSGTAPAGGGGGRIAILYDSLTLPDDNLRTYGGDVGDVSGGAGTIYLKDKGQPRGDLIVDNQGVESSLETVLRTGLTSLRTLTVRDRGRLRLTSSGSPTLTIHQGILLTSNASLVQGADLTLIVLNDTGFDVEIGSGTTFTSDAGADLSADGLLVNGTFNLSHDMTIPPGGACVVDGGTLNLTGAGFTVPSAYDFELTGNGTVNLHAGSTFDIAAFDPTNMAAGTFYVGSGARLNIAADAAAIGGGVTLVKDGSFGASDEIGSLTVRSGGVVTHSSRYLPGLTLKATGFIDVQAGGSIDVSGKGLRGGYTAGYGVCGEHFDLNDNIVLNCFIGTPGAYGGAGDWYEPVHAPYGYLEAPAHLGSGGAGGSGGNHLGGAGGGRVTVATPNLTLNGSIRANGLDLVAGGGGSGGAIRLDVPGALSGTGSIWASGGVPPPGYLGEGGGGRIAIYFGFLGLPTANVRAYGGAFVGGAGTIYLKDIAQTDGEVIVDNAGGSSTVTLQTPLRTTLSTFRSIVVRNRGRLEIGSGLLPHLWVTDLTVDAGTVEGSARDLGGMRISVSGVLSLSNSGRIESNGTGLRGGRTAGNPFGAAGEAYDGQGLTVVAGSTLGSGGSYGGFGGGPSPNAVYGDSFEPQAVGSGGSYCADFGTGGPGGGLIWIDADTCHIPAGTGISANGGMGLACAPEDMQTVGCFPGDPIEVTGSNGGGSGGTVRLDCVHIDGDGTLSANGGNGLGSDGNGGGGGRIARHYTFDAFTGTVEARGGESAGGGQPGADGSSEQIFVPSGSGLLIDSISPTQGSNTGTATLIVLGSQFDPAADVRLTRSGFPDIAGQVVTVDPDGTRVAARFNLSGGALGLWDVVVTNPEGRRAAKAAVFEIVQGSQAFFVRLHAPSTVRPLRNYSLTVEYGNDGDVDMPAQIVQLSNNRGAPMRLSTAERYAPGPLQILAIGPPGLVDVLPPHSSFSVRVYFLCPDLPGHDFFQFNAVQGLGDATALDWAGIEQAVRPPGMADDAWQAILGNLQAQIGPTAASFLNALTTDAVYLAAHDSRTYSVSDLLAFEFLRARGGLNPASLVSTAVDDTIATTGLPLVFTRTASADIAGRFQLGPLGRGWTHNFEISIIRRSAVEVFVAGPGSSPRRFTNHRGTAWEGFAGDTGRLATSTGGDWLLTEKDGKVLTFDPNGVLQSIEDANGNFVTLSYTDDRLVQIAHSDGVTLTLDYSPGGRITRVTDSFGREFDYAYDGGEEHLLSVTGPGGAATAYSYNAVQGSPSDHALTEIALPGGTHEYFDYDSSGRLISRSGDGGAGRMDFTYGEPGEIQTQDAAGAVSRDFRGAHGEVLESVDALDRTTRNTHDEHHRVAGVAAPGGVNTVRAYDAAGNRRLETDALGNSVTMGYAAGLGRLEWVRDQRNNLTAFTVDAGGNTMGISRADGTASTATYDTRGRLLTATNRRGQFMEFERDLLGRLSEKRFPDGRTISYSYDARGNLLSAADSLTGTVVMTFDDRDLMTSILYPGGNGFTFSYDAGGRRTQRVGQDGFTVNYAYDAAGRLATVSSGTGTTFAQYTYDLAGRLSRLDRGNGAYTTYSYYADGRTASQVNHAPDGAVQSFFDIFLDPRGRPASMTTTSGTSTYAYDDLDQLTEVEYPDGRVVTYSYDASGNRVLVSDDGVPTAYTCDVMDRYTEAGSALFDYDADGNMTARTDPSGTTTFEWDAEGRLTGVVSPTTGTWEFVYDALGNRTASIHNGVRTNYLNDPIGLVDVAAELDGSTNVIARYVHGDGLIARVDAAGNPAYYGFDTLGDTRQLTDAGGAVIAAYDYDAYGAPTIVSGTMANPYQFVGALGIATEGSGLQYMRARYYDPELGRFNAEDPIGIAGGLNLYRYVANRPTELVDPSGTTHRICSKGICIECDHAYCWEVLECMVLLSDSEAACESFICTGKPCGCGSQPPCMAPDIPLPMWAPLGPGNPVTLDPVTSGDPNEKLGPDGFDPGNLPSNPRFIRGADPFAYTIHFENVATASAPAQEVVVTDNLDPALDFDSFAIGEVAFGDYVAGGLAGLPAGSTTVPLEDSPYLVTVSVEHAPGSGLVRWILRTIDPLTNDLPEDALAGFLPPNDATGRGEGHVSFTIRPRNDLAGTTQISNSASIVFDTNAAIATNTWVNTIDNDAPTSTVTSLAHVVGTPPNQRRVSWSGSDVAGGSGLRDYTIYLSDGGGPYAAWRSDTGATAADLTLACSHTYRFHSRARDYVGNVEDAPGGGADLTYQAAPDADHDLVCDDLDNCAGVTNPTQEDGDGNGVGDACDANPTFSVSSSPADAADFASIQAAVDAATLPGSSIRILPGLGYLGTILVDAGKQLSFVGDPAQGEVVIDGASGPAFDVRSTSGAAAIVFRNLTITGQDGIRTMVPIEVSAVRFQEIPGTAVQASQAAHLENVLVVASGRGIRIDAGGSLQMEYSTLVGGSGPGVENAGAGEVTIATSIVYGSGGGDLVDVPCSSVSFSDVGTPDCTGQNGNLSAPPSLTAEMHLSAASPCLDAGPDPATYGGEPLADLAGGLRLRDYDGDGLARSDMGAFEAQNTTLAPAEVTGLRWTDPSQMTWDALPEAVEYHLYRGTLPASYASFGSCYDAADSSLMDTVLIDASSPPSGQGWFFLVTGEDSLGSEGTSGFARGAERSRFEPCL